ncbi:MAG: redoxin domain-containing protein [Planctomycetes bacterium]|nr:redoxin domain-containing protein [Planctomycetota bacterium]
MFKRIAMASCAAALSLLVSSTQIAQEAPRGEPELEAPKEFDSYNVIFECFAKRYEIEQTKLDRLARDAQSKPEDRQAIFTAIKKIDLEYVEVLRKYLDKFPNAKDLEPARYEIVLTLSRHEEKFDDAVKAADSYLKEHAGSERAKDIHFARAQTLARMAGREDEALLALDTFIKQFPGSDEADFARTLRVRVLLFIDKTQEAEEALNAILKMEKVRKNAEAKQYIERQLDDLDWIGREMPRFALATLDGRAIANSDFEGKPMLLFVWDSNSGVCLEELGYVKAVNDKLKDRGFTVLALSVNESKPALEQWLKRNPLGTTVAWEDREAEGTLIKRLDINAIPFGILVDSKGKIYRYDVRSDELMRYATRMVEQGK